MNVAIITARGGSKRIPRKNIKDFCGKPIIQYSIEAALNSKIFDEVMVSTDDEEIKEIAIKCGAKVPFLRTEKTSNDLSATHEVLLEVIENYNKIGRTFDNICCIYPTAPFVTANKLIEAMNKLTSTDCDSVMPIVAFSFPPQRGLILNDNNIKFMWPENSLKRSQDLQTMYHDCGQFYCLKTDSFLKEKRLIMEKTKAIIMNEMEVQDIDNEEDWKVAELKYQILQNMK